MRTATRRAISVLAMAGLSVPAARARGDVDGGARAAAGVASAAPTSTSASPYARRPIETACNGLDDDGDGMIDVLPPTGANACNTGRAGACGPGFAACLSGTRVCLAPSPTPEVRDGIDNDCNGVVDDVPKRSARPRAFVIAPRYAWTEAATDIATVSSVLAQAGIPFDRAPAGSDWTQVLDKLGDYSLVLVPGYLTAGSVTTDIQNKLEAFAKKGGVVLVWKPLGTKDQKGALKLVGLKSSVRRRDAVEIRFDGIRSALVAELDSPEERTLRINPAPKHPDGVELYAFEPEPGTEVVAMGRGAREATGPAITRRRVGDGAIYAVGHDLATFATTPCYVNCFVPSGDVLRLMLRGAMREAASGHVVFTHTAPDDARGVVILTHDVDSIEAYGSGTWGDAGALQIADVERARGVRGTYFLATGQKGGHFDGTTARALCKDMSCGAHGVSQPRTFATLPEGVCDGQKPAAPNAPPTLCAELQGSLDRVRDVAGRAVRAWRSPYLALHPRQYVLLAKSGVDLDSGFGVGDLPYNLPVNLETVGSHPTLFRAQPILELPIALEDEDPVIVRGQKGRRALEPETRGHFESAWVYVMLRNLQNASFTTLHVRPWRNSSPSPASLSEKVIALGHFVDEAQAAGARFMTVEEAGDFWRARLATGVDARYEEGVGYTGTITSGAKTTPGLTLELGDRIKSFTCDACGEVRTSGTRVTLVRALAPGSTAHFKATVE